MYTECKSNQIAARGRVGLAAPIFVVGYMHSGTTLLLNILGKSSSVYSSRGETKFFDRLPIIRSNYRDLSDDSILRDLIHFTIGVIRSGSNLRGRLWRGEKDPDIADEDVDAIFSEVKFCREHGNVFRATFDYLTYNSGKSRWLEKTPTHIFSIDEILRHIPNALFVEIVRDPRDILASKKTRVSTVTSGRYKPEQIPLKRLEKAYDPLWDTLSWKSAISAGRAARDKYPGKLFSIRYEDLVTDPESVVRRVCDFLDLEFELATLEISSRNAADWKSEKQSGIVTESIGRWQKVLDPAEVAICEWLTRTEMQRLQYSRQSTLSIQHLKIPIILAKSIFEFGHRLYRRLKLGGASFLLNVLINYWKRLLKLLS